MNWWMVAAGVLQLGASISAASNGKWWFAGVYLCYFLASIFLFMSEYKFKL